MIKTISSREVYRNPWTRVREDITELPNGTRSLYGVVEKDPAAIILPIERTETGDFIWLVRQYRYTVGSAYFELPQGGWEEASVEPEELARGELAEETGLRAGTMTRIASLWIGYGVMRQVQHVFLAENLSPGDTSRDPEEQDMTVHRVAVGEFETMLLDGRVADNCTASAWGVYRVWRDRQGQVQT